MSDRFDEYNNGYNSDNNSNSSYYDSTRYSDSYTYESTSPYETKKEKKHIGLKITAAVLALGVAGGVCFQGVKIFKSQDEGRSLSKFTNETTVTTSYETTTGSSDKDNKDKHDDGNVSLFQLAAREDAKPIPQIVDEIMPSFVGISSTFEATSNYGFGWGSPTTQRFVATGTGIIMTEDGYIVTNAHVIYDDSSQYTAGEAVEVSVLFSDESVHDAKIIAYDVKTDLAVLKVNETGLTPATFGDSNELRVGELVIAVGNPLGFELFGTVTSGIVSALNREVTIGDKNMTLIQTDAAINSGNSGGPLLNSCGQVIGINSAKMSSSYGSASIEGLGFAIPITEAQKIIDDLINYNYVKGRPQIGIVTAEINESYSRYLNLPMGVYVRSVEEGSAAEAAGIQTGDVIIGVDNEAIKTSEELAAIKNKHKAGDTIILTVYRNGKDIDIKLVLQEESAGNDKK